MANFQSIGNQTELPNRMRIQPFDPDNKSGGSKKAYTFLVNPTSYSVTHEACYDKNQSIKGTGTTFAFNKVKPQGMKIDLLFDSTGSLGQLPTGNQSVLEQINNFLEVAFITYEKGQVPQMVQLIWGEMEFKGVLQTIDITYSHFDPTGAPIRAKAACGFSGGSLRFNSQDPTKEGETIVPAIVVDYSKEKHAINAVQRHGSYI
ncbi:MAG: hypothetical protein A3D92_13170, partial [Bacteroidetes bacterium RIFCSPHIGHO2_02_FULL_44_7]